MLNNYSALLIWLCAAASAGIFGATIDYRLPKAVLPTHYDLHLRTEVHTGAKEFRGTVQISVQVVEPTRKIVLHSLGLTIQNVSLFNSVGYALEDSEMSFNVEKQQLILSYDRKLRLGSYILWIEFVTTTNNGWNVLSHDDEAGSRKYVLVTRFEPTYARSAFPCFDEPGFKATFSLEVVHHRELTVDANMPLIGKPKLIDKDYLVSKFERTPKMSTFLLAFIVTQGYRSFGSGNHTIKANRSELSKTLYTLEVAKEILEVLDQYMGLSYQDYLPRLTHLEIPIESNRVENEKWGLIVHNENSLTSLKSISRKLAHMWFGGLVTPEWWDNIWLKEGFVELYAYYALDLARPSERWMEWFNVAEQPVGMQSDTYLDRITNVGCQTLDQINNFNRPGVFERAAGVLNMIRQIVGDSTWQLVVRSFLKKHQLATVVPTDLYAELERFTNGSELFPTNSNIERIMNMWMTNSRIPEITVERRYNESTITITQNEMERDLSNVGYFVWKMYQLRRMPDQNQFWIIPYNYAQESDANFGEVGPVHWLAEPSIVVPTTANSNEWILLGKRHFGLYRINYDEQNWQLLAQALRSNISCIPPENRAKLLADALYFHEKDRLDKTVLFELLTFLANETDSLVWYAALPVIDTFKGDRSAKNQYIFKIFLKHLTKSYFVSILSSTATSSYDESVRRSISFLTCQVGNLDCISAAYDKFQEAHRANSSDLLSDPSINVFCFGIQLTSDQEFRWLLQQFDAANEDKRKLLMKYLACVKQPDRLRTLIEQVNQDLSLLDSLYHGLKVDLGESPCWRLVELLNDHEFTERINIRVIHILLMVMNERTQSQEAEKAVLDVRNWVEGRLRKIWKGYWRYYHKLELEDPDNVINKRFENFVVKHGLK